jgi:DNA-binding NarL/FixJ family response regulator
MSTVLLGSNEPILAEGLAAILSNADGLELCPPCPIDDLSARLALHEPDVLLLDLTRGIDLSFIGRIQETASHRPKIVLWVHSVSTELALQAMSLGIRGIISKTLPIDTLIRCLMRVSGGELWFDKTLTDSIMSTRRYSLTRREGQLVTLLSQGLKNKEIATALLICEGTVKVYLSRLFQKLNVKDRFELALFGLKNLTHGANLSQVEDKTRPVEAPRSFFVERMAPQSEMRQSFDVVSRRA